MLILCENDKPFTPSIYNNATLQITDNGVRVYEKWNEKEL